MIPPAPQTFTFFPQLPTEIRLDIWNLAIQHRTRRVVIVSYSIDSHGVIRFKSRTRPLGPPALLYTCSESREIALTVYRPAFGDTDFDPPFPSKPLRGALQGLAGGLFKRKGGKGRTGSISKPSEGHLRPPHIYVDFSRDAIYFQQLPEAESVFDGVLRGMPREERLAIKVLGIGMDLCPMRRFDEIHHLFCGLDEWVLFARSAVGESGAPFANVQLSTVFFSDQNHVAGSPSEKVERQIQNAFERRRGQIERDGGKIPKIKVEDHTNILSQVAVVRRDTR
jgi:hypothetical protein